jgi:hypothetical protein
MIPRSLYSSGIVIARHDGVTFSLLYQLEAQPGVTRICHGAPSPLAIRVLS